MIIIKIRRVKSACSKLGGIFLGTVGAQKPKKCLVKKAISKP